MALRRMLWKRVSTSRKVNKLSLKAALLWTWVQPHLDVEGYLEVEADYLKATVVPMRKDFPAKELPRLVREIINIGLWEEYRCNGVSVIREGKFDEMQSHKKSDETPSLYANKVERVVLEEESDELDIVVVGKGVVSSKLRGQIFTRDKLVCQYCHKQCIVYHRSKNPDYDEPPPEISDIRLVDVATVDHIIPRSKGGSDDVDNLITACFYCNARKGAKSLESKETTGGARGGHRGSTEEP